MEKKTEFSLSTEEGMNALLERVANGILDGSMTKSQADPVNTTCKLKLNLLTLKKNYLQLALEAYKPQLRKGEIDPDTLFKKLPTFFGGQPEDLVRIEQK